MTLRRYLEAWVKIFAIIVCTFGAVSVGFAIAFSGFKLFGVPGLVVAGVLEFISLAAYAVLDIE